MTKKTKPGVFISARERSRMDERNRKRYRRLYGSRNRRLTEGQMLRVMEAFWRSEEGQIVLRGGQFAAGRNKRQVIGDLHDMRLARLMGKEIA
jgi:hypothetical protein